MPPRYRRDRHAVAVDGRVAQMDAIAGFGGTPILFQTSQLHGKSAQEKAAVYREASRGYAEVVAFELGQMFAPNGEIFETEMILRLMDIPEIRGIKHSSLDRLVELQRLALRLTGHGDRPGRRRVIAGR